MEPITNLAITGITKPKQMKKLAKLTNTPQLMCPNQYKNINGVVHTGGSVKYNDWINRAPEDSIKMTWKEFLAQYDKKKKKWSTDNLADKDLVYCWDDEDTSMRTLKFWDKVNKCTFSFKGERHGERFHNYEPFTYAREPKWAKNARVLLED